MDKNKHQSGQILLITLLILTVVITIGVALIGRTRTDVTSSAEIEESARAFSAAEAGIEQALISGGGTQGEITLSNNNASYSTNVSDIGGAPTGAYMFQELTTVGDTETLWLVGHNSQGGIDESIEYNGNSIDVCWKGVGATTPALAAIVVYKTAAGQYRTAQSAFDPLNNRENNFSATGATGNGCGQTGVYKQTITFGSFSPAIVAADKLLMLRLRPFYADAFVSVDAGGNNLPAQGKLITSEGSTETGITRRVVVSQQFRSPSGIFDAAVISQTNFSR